MADGWFHQLGEADFELLKRIDHSAWAVFLSLRWFARNGDTCYPSVGTIAKMVHLTERSVHYALARLLEEGLVDRKANRGKATVYRLLGGATDCTSPIVTSAIDCIPPLQSIAVTPATSCIPPLQPVADKVEAMNKTQEIDSLKRTKRGCAAEVVIPSKLSSEVFKEAWQRWLAYRRNRRLTCTPATLQGQLQKLATLGPSAAINEIDRSITNGWQSVCYEPPANTRPANNYANGPGQVFDPNSVNTEKAVF